MYTSGTESALQILFCGPCSVWSCLLVSRTPVQAEAEEEMRSLCVPGTEGEQEAKLEGAMKEQLRVPVMLAPRKLNLGACSQQNSASQKETVLSTTVTHCPEP